MELKGGQVWVLPVDADDVVPVTKDVVSYEQDGTMHLAQSIGTLNRASFHATAVPDETINPELKAWLDRHYR